MNVWLWGNCSFLMKHSLRISVMLCRCHQNSWMKAINHIMWVEMTHINMIYSKNWYFTVLILPFIIFVKLIMNKWHIGYLILEINNLKINKHKIISIFTGIVNVCPFLWYSQHQHFYPANLNRFCSTFNGTKTNQPVWVLCVFKRDTSLKTR